MSKTYEDGLNEAWEVVRRLYNELGLDKRVELFGYCAPREIVNALTPQEAIEKIREYEEEQKKAAEIKIGDEVTDNDGWEGVVAWIDPDGEYLIILQKDGTALRWKKDIFKKTGRHFSQIEEVLKQMQEGEE